MSEEFTQTSSLVFYIIEILFLWVMGYGQVVTIINE